jgi:hypothetical protein
MQMNAGGGYRSQLQMQILQEIDAVVDIDLIALDSVTEFGYKQRGAPLTDV